MTYNVFGETLNLAQFNSIQFNFELEESCRTRGHSFKSKKRRSNTDLRQHFFYERIVNIGNALDDDSMYQFIECLQKWSLSTTEE